MLTVATFFYGLIASFVVASFKNNKRAERPHPELLLAFGWFLLSFSVVTAPLLLGYVALAATGYMKPVS